MLCQIIIFASTLGFMLLAGLNDNPRTRGWGFVCGFLGQPFWIWTAWVNGQVGILASSAFFTVVYLYGIIQFVRRWLRLRRAEED